MPDFLFKELFRPVICFRLHILTESKRNRPTISRIGHGAEGAGQGSEKLFRPGDPVEIAANRTKTVIHGHSAVIEVFDLLQHGIRSTIGKDVAGNEENW